MTDPAPLAKFEGFGDTSLDFKLLAWVSTIDVGDRAQTALRIAILGKLGGAASITPLPQREVHLRAVNEPAPLAGAAENEDRRSVATRFFGCLYDRLWPGLPVRGACRQLPLGKQAIEPKDCCRARLRTGSPGQAVFPGPLENLASAQL